MWKHVGINAVVLAALGTTLNLVFQLFDWWTLGGLVVIWASVDTVVWLTVRSPSARILTEISLSAIVLILLVFDWIEPGPPIQRAYKFTATKAKSLLADYRIRDAVDYLAETSPPVRRIFTDFSQSRGKFIATIHLFYRRNKYRGRIVSLVASLGEELVYEYSRQYISSTTNKAALDHFHALVAGTHNNRHQSETSCIGYLAGRAHLREVILMRADGDVRFRVRDTAEKVISNAGSISRNANRLSPHLTDARRIVAAALNEIKPMLAATNEEAGNRRRPGCEFLRALARQIGRLRPDKAGPIVKIILSNRLLIKAPKR